ncbi:response regulator transcription factor [Nitratifractor sp.]
MGRIRIFLLEDDAALRETLVDFLENNGFELCWAADGERAEDLLYEERFDLILLDVNVPGLDGFSLLRRVRERGEDVPAIFLTARNGVEDLEEGFTSGGDDYLRKPFSLRELLLRIQALLRRKGIGEHGERIVGEGVVYDPAARELRTPEGPVGLSAKEARLLELFLDHPDTVLSHERIFDAVWDYGETPSDSSLRTYIKKLRKHIGRDRIVSLKKQGYRYVAQK